MEDEAPRVERTVFVIAVFDEGSDCNGRLNNTTFSQTAGALMTSINYHLYDLRGKDEQFSFKITRDNEQVDVIKVNKGGNTGEWIYFSEDHDTQVEKARNQSMDLLKKKARDYMNSFDPNRSSGPSASSSHLKEDLPRIRIGPEPTTDRFLAVMYGDEEGVIPENALVVDAKKQFRALSGFGNAFLNIFQCSSQPNQVLESVTIVDTLGFVSCEKQRIDRGYDFTGVLVWFAERLDLIILLFDAHKLDISDEFKRCIEAFAGNEDKICIVFNKSEMVDHQQMIRVYGSLMWSLGKVLKPPEFSRIYLGSFWDHPLHYDINRRLFEDEQHDLLQDLQAIPRNAAHRKLNDLAQRVRLAQVHAYIISLRKQMPSMIGKEKKKNELILNLDKIFEQIQREHNISPGGFPDIHKMREKLQNQDFTKFNPLKPKLLEVVDGMLASDIAAPGIRIGPEPTTDRFLAVMYGDEEGVIPENALVVDAKKQFRALSG